MKLFAQHGAMAGEKIGEALSAGVIDGVIFSPRDIGADKLKQKLTEFRALNSSLELILDPQYYAAPLALKSDARVGNLPDSYGKYFLPRRRQELEREKNVEEIVRSTLSFQAEHQLSSLIGPNIVIPRSLNSIEAVISKSFLRKTCELQSEYDVSVFATIAIDRDALMDREELDLFLDELTSLDKPLKGVYLLISATDSDARFDIYNADVIANWMFINHVFSLNGTAVINGFSDILSPLLGAAGGHAGATGWWSNLRLFSLDRFEPNEGGGRLPNPRYLSCNLWNRIAFFELHRLRQKFPKIMNGLSTDGLYPVENGSEPQRNKECIQAWQATKDLILKQQLTEDVEHNIAMCHRNILSAQQLYAEIEARMPIPRLEEKSNAEHLEAMKQGIELFAKKAELKLL